MGRVIPHGFQVCRNPPSWRGFLCLVFFGEVSVAAQNLPSNLQSDLLLGLGWDGKHDSRRYERRPSARGRFFTAED